jgi:outer membrane protein assembly factor BamB
MEASSVTIRNGLAYLCSNTGAVAALEADTGEIVWLHTYEQAKRRTNLYTREERTTTTWYPNPPMLDHRLLYVTPRDADRLFIYHQRPDLETGFIVHDHFGRDQIVNGFDPEYMIGVRDGVVFLAGSSRTRGERPLFAVKSGPLAPAGDGEPADQQRILWRAEIEEDAPSGRGVLAGEAIYFPTEKGIYRVSISDGAVTRLLDISDFPDEEDPDWVPHPIGNLAVSGPWLLTASKDAVSLFGPPPEQKDEPEMGD